MNKADFREMVQLGFVQLSDEDRKTILTSGNKYDFDSRVSFSEDELLDKLPALDRKSVRITVGE